MRNSGVYNIAQMKFICQIIFSPENYGCFFITIFLYTFSRPVIYKQKLSVYIAVPLLYNIIILYKQNLMNLIVWFFNLSYKSLNNKTWKTNPKTCGPAMRCNLFQALSMNSEKVLFSDLNQKAYSICGMFFLRHTDVYSVRLHSADGTRGSRKYLRTSLRELPINQRVLQHAQR